MISRRLRVGLLALITLAVLAVPATAAIPLTQAKATAYKAGVVAAKQTHGYSPRVVSCKPLSSRRSLCKVKILYKKSPKTCVLDVVVRYRSGSRTRLTYAFGKTVCS